MEITVRDIMEIGPLREAKLLAGKHRADNIVKGITIIEVPDIVDWLSGGEILLTSLYNVRNEIMSFRDYIRMMAQREVSALIIKTGRVVEEIPQEIIQAGDEFGLPIIELGREVKFVDVMYPVMAELFNKEVSKLQYYKQVQDHFTELVIAGEGLEGISRVLEELIGNPVIIYDKEYKAMAATDHSVTTFGEVQDSTQRENLNEKFYYYRQEVVFPDLNNITATQVVIPIQQLNQINAYLVVVEINKRLTDIEYIILENASTVISLELVKRFAISEVERRFKNDLLDSLISGNILIETALERASIIGWDLKGPYCIVLMEFLDINDYLTGKKQRTNFITEVGSTVANVINEYTKHFMRISSDSLYVLWPTQGKSEAPVVADIKKASLKISALFAKKYPKMHISTGVGSIAVNIKDIADSYREAKNAINIGRIMNEAFISFSELGIMRMLCQLGVTNDLTEFVPKSINNLILYDKENKTNLLNTFEVFLKNNSNATHTAKELFIHYKTILYRLEKIREISGIDFSNHKDRLEAELGLKIVSLLKTCK
ncbi:MAG: PucR family transcriptional regulator ligand-binding domain-containing protein [Desulfosporosinus sp.]|nr:PucR family transcriptional regulator ligand-binding domain-containing protein [Desulfosporosinus sp.]MDA8223633.1 PucR family transcriptional regulator ligand-binding domain-containing protein [Desulfitobacterium hafniense]